MVKINHILKIVHNRFLDFLKIPVLLQLTLDLLWSSELTLWATIKKKKDKLEYS